MARRFGYVRKLPSGRFQASYTGADGLRRTADHTYATRAEADDWLTDQRRAIERGGWQDPSKGRTALRTYALRWLQSRTDLKRRTVDLYADSLDRHILPQLGGIRMSAIDPETVRTWHSNLIYETTVTKRRHAYCVLRAIMNQAVRDGYVPSNPCQIRGAGHAAQQARVRPPDLAEISQIAATVPDRFRALVLLAAFGGLRLGELMALTRQDVSLDPFMVTVTGTMQQYDGQWVKDTPKTAAGRRTVALPDVIAADVRRHLAEHVGRSPEALLFATSSGKPFSRSNWNKQFKRACREGCGRDDFRFHDLRHAAATVAAQSGASLADLMARLGHSSPRAALIYQHAAAERDALIAEAISQATSQATAGVVPLRRAR